MYKGYFQEMLRALGQHEQGEIRSQGLHKSHRCPGQATHMAELSIVGQMDTQQALVLNQGLCGVTESRTWLSIPRSPCLLASSSTDLSRGHQRAVPKPAVEEKVARGVDLAFRKHGHYPPGTASSVLISGCFLASSQSWQASATLSPIPLLFLPAQLQHVSKPGLEVPDHSNLQTSLNPDSRCPAAP